MLYEIIENERVKIYGRAVALVDEFILLAKPLRKDGNYFFYEPRARSDKGKNVTYIYWADIKITKKRDGSYYPHIKHLKKGNSHKYSLKSFRKKSPELDLIIEFEEEFAKLRAYTEAINMLEKTITKAEILSSKIEW